MHQQIKDFLRYWVELRGGSELPSRGQIDPLTIPRHLLAKVHLMTFDEARGDIRYTLVGSHVHAVRGTEISGTYVSESPNRIGGSREAYAEHVRELYRSARRSRRPVHSRGTYHWVDGRGDVTTERVTCPILGRDGSTVEFTGIQIYDRAAGTAMSPVNTADDYAPHFIRVLDDPDSLVT